VTRQNQASTITVQRVHVFISGVVQGVGFRDFTVQHAAELGVAGYVRNLADGRVEAVLQGSPESVAKMIELLRVGLPASARVKNFELSEEQPQEDSEGFSRLE
jgi:acylphosphatase